MHIPDGHSVVLKEISTEHKAVLWGVDTMYPTGRNENGLSRTELTSVALVHLLHETTVRPNKTQPNNT